MLYRNAPYSSKVIAEGWLVVVTKTLVHKFIKRSQLVMTDAVITDPAWLMTGFYSFKEFSQSCIYVLDGLRFMLVGCLVYESGVVTRRKC